jgi:hypothetical protein
MNIVCRVYKQQGWEGFRWFRISKLECMSNSTKIILEPVDGKEVCTPERGQFVCMRISVDGFGSIHKNMTIGPAFKCPERPSSSMRSSSSFSCLRSDSDCPYEPIFGYETILNRKGSREDYRSRIPATMIETNQIIANAIKEGDVLELSVPLGCPRWLHSLETEQILT